jgi:hypothetical protein
MTLELIRRNMAKFEDALKLYLFTRGDITAIEKNLQRGEEEPAPAAKNLRRTVGEMKGS